MLAAAPLALDTTFSGDGLLNISGLVQELAIQSDGKIVVAGATGTTPFDFFVQRFLPSGAPDQDFGDQSRAIVDFNGGHDLINGIVIQADGKILVGGGATDGTIRKYGLARLDADGNLDPEFGVGGKVSLDVGSSAEIEDVIIQSDGKIMTLDSRFQLARFHADGSLDLSYGGGDGIATPSPGARGSELLALPGDNVLAVGTSGGGNSSSQMLVASINASGNLNTGFGAGGRAFLQVPGSYDEAYGATLQPDGKIVVAGRTSRDDLFPPVDDLAIVRLTSSGQPDPTFGYAGVAVRPLGTGADTAVDALVQPNGKIILAASGPGGRGLVRLTPTGLIDATHFFPIGSTLHSGHMEFDSEGNVVALLRNGFSYSTQLVRYLADETPPTGELGGVVWHDGNADGTQDPLEPALEGIEVYLDLDGSGSHTPEEPLALTDRNGVYRFFDVLPGSYEVRNLLTHGVSRTVVVAAGDVYQPPVLDFEELAHQGDFVAIDNYQRAGFRISSSANAQPRWRVYGPEESISYVGSATLTNVWIPTTTTLARIDGRAFDLLSIDFSRWRSNFSGSNVTLTGRRSDGSTIVQSAPANAFGLRRTEFVDFDNVIRVEWTIPGTGPSHQFDNVRLQVDDELFDADADFGVTLPGDFTSDERVDGADLARWRAAFGVNATADADSDGDSDGADFLAWQRNLGAAFPPAASTVASHAATSSARAALIDAAIAYDQWLRNSEDDWDEHRSKRLRPQR